MTQTATIESGLRAGREAARMYPNNSLKKVEGEFQDSFRETVMALFKK